LAEEDSSQVPRGAADKGMSFSNWQIRRLRSRLRSYREHQGLKQMGRPLPWKYLDSIIAKTLDLDFDLGGANGERLRQFIEGVPVAKGSREKRFPVMEEHKLEALRDFLMHRDIRFLAEHELEEQPVNHQAALSLLDYLHEGRDVGPGDRPNAPERLACEQITGIYQNVKPGRDKLRCRRLSLNQLSEGMFEVLEVLEVYDGGEAAGDFARWTEAKRQRLRRVTRKNVGWAVKNDNDCLFVFLKDSYDSSQASYLVAARHLPEDAEEAIAWLLLQRYGPATYYRHGMENLDRTKQQTLDRLDRAYLFRFDRVE